jgi:hypothetical protein
MRVHATGRRSTSYVSSSADDDFPRSAASSFHARLCASAIPVFAPKHAARGRQGVRGVAGDKNAALLEAIGYKRAELPTPRGDDLKVDVGASRRPHGRFALLGFHAFLLIEEHEHPAAIAVGREERTQVGLIHLELVDLLLQVGVELGRREEHAAHGLKMPGALPADAERFTHGALPSIGRDHIRGTQLIGAPALLFDGRGDAAFVLRELDELAAES